jgi:hypothetical protein
VISNSIHNIEGFLLSSHAAASIDLLNGRKRGDPITSRVFGFTSNAQNCLGQRGALQPQSASTKSYKPNSGHQLPFTTSKSLPKEGILSEQVNGHLPWRLLA